MPAPVLARILRGGPRSSLLTNLVSYWKLDEASGVAADSAGANTLTANNSPAGAAGKIGQGRQFVAASSQYLSHADNASLETGNVDWTAALWWHPVDNPATNYGLFCKSSNDGLGDYCIDHSVSHGANFLIGNGGSTQLLAGTGFINLGAWNLIIAWHDSVAQKMYLQVNHQAVPDVLSMTLTPASSSNAFALGSFTGGVHPANGILDEVGLWKSAPGGGGVLTAAQRDAVWNSGNGISWPFTGASI